MSSPSFNYSFNSAVPAPNNNPSADQPEMLTNNISTAAYVAVDHAPFGTDASGLHQQVRMPRQATPSNFNNYGLVWCNSGKSVGSNTETNLFYSPDDTSQRYQLTRCITSKKSLFGTNTNYTGTNYGGWTFLPGGGSSSEGGMLMQYGKATIALSGTLTTVTFPVTYLNVPYSVNITMIYDDNSTSPGANSVYVVSGSVGTSSFKVSSTSSVHITEIYWQAIGV